MKICYPSLKLISIKHSSMTLMRQSWISLIYLEGYTANSDHFLSFYLRKPTISALLKGQGNFYSIYSYFSIICAFYLNYNNYGLFVKPKVNIYGLFNFM